MARTFLPTSLTMRERTSYGRRQLNGINLFVRLSSGLLASSSGRAVPLAQIPGVPAAVQATIYYQSIPPYYLRQRSDQGHGPDTARLIKFTSKLDVDHYPEIASWKLAIASSGVVGLR